MKKKKNRKSKREYEKRKLKKRNEKERKKKEIKEPISNHNNLNITLKINNRFLYKSYLYIFMKIILKFLLYFFFLFTN